MDTIAEIKKLMSQKKLVIGTNNVLKGLRSKSLQRVFVSSNCPEDVFQDVQKYAKITNTPVIQLDIPNEEFGTVCKKPFFVSLAGVKSQ